MRNQLIALAVSSVLVAAGLAQPEAIPLRVRGQQQQAGQSDYEFARTLVQKKTNTLNIGDFGWERQQQLLDSQYERELYRVFEEIAALRQAPLLGYDLVIRYQQEVVDHWDTYVGKMDSLLAGVDGSDSLVDRTLAAEYRAAKRKGELELMSARDKLTMLRIQRSNAALKK